MALYVDTYAAVTHAFLRCDMMAWLWFEKIQLLWHRCVDPGDDTLNACRNG